MTSSIRGCLIALMFGAALAGCGPNGAAPPEAAPAETDVAASKPDAIGACVETTVTLTGPRLEGVADSGSAITYANGMSQVSYDVIPGVSSSSVGDAVRLCLVSIPENCPPGDDRGRVYDATNLRTGETWSAPDSQHMCGGA